MLSAAERHGRRRGSWKTRPIRGSGPSIGAPSRRASPASGRSRPAMTRRSVDLPLPLGPMRATMPPPGTSRSMPSRTGRRAAVATRERQPDAVAARGRRVAARHAGRQRPEDRRDRRVERGVRLVQRGRRSRRAPGRARARGRCGSSPGSPASTSGAAPTATAPRIAEPRTAVSSTAGTRTRNPVTSALIWFQASLRAGPPQARIASTRHAGREHRRRRRGGSPGRSPRGSPG